MLLQLQAGCMRRCCFIVASFVAGKGTSCASWVRVFAWSSFCGDAGGSVALLETMTALLLVQKDSVFFDRVFRELIRVFVCDHVLGSGCFSWIERRPACRCLRSPPFPFNVSRLEKCGRKMSCTRVLDRAGRSRAFQVPALLLRSSGPADC